MIKRFLSACAFLLCATLAQPVHAQTPSTVPPANGLDAALRARAGGLGTSRVIIQSSDEKDITKTLQKIRGRHLRDLRGAHVVDVPNSQIAELARHGKLSTDRVASGTLFRVTGTIGSDVVNRVLRYTGAGVGVAVIDSGVAAFH